MSEAVPYSGPDRRVAIPVDEVLRLTEQVQRLVETNSSLSLSLEKVAEISAKQIKMEGTALTERAAVRARWNRDNYIVGLLVLILVGFGVVVYRQHLFAHDNAAQIRSQEEQRLNVLVTAQTKCNTDNRSSGDQLHFLQALVPLSTAKTQALLQNYIAVYPGPTDCSIYPAQILTLQKQLGHG